jgi:DNA-directed RNA polymerase subunit E'/Rpb7
MEGATKKMQKMKRRDAKLSSIYSRCLITKNVMLPITSIGKNLQQTIEENVSANYEGKCMIEGYIKPQSCKVLNYSSGIIDRGILFTFKVTFEAEVCFPVEGTLIQCIAKNITKAGIRAVSATEFPSPIDVFLARDHHRTTKHFNDVKEGDDITVRILGQRFELNDRQVSVIAELVKPKPQFITTKEISKPKLIIEDENVPENVPENE